jgi:hypothetical protein
MKKVIRLTESDLTRIIKRVISEQSEHTKNLYKSWANKKSGNPEKALSIMDDVLKLQKQLPKKDFAQYSSYEELVKDLDKIKQAAKSEDVTKIYEDRDLLVLAANTYEASCKYGAGSQWCTTAKDTDSYWRRHNELGTEFFWIFKGKPQTDPNYKFSYHVKLKREPDWCNSINHCTSTSRLSQDSYPKQHPKYDEIIQKLQEFHDARELVEPEKDRKWNDFDRIQSWIDRNYFEIENIAIDNNFINKVKNEVQDYFMSTGVFDSLPYGMDKHDDGVDDFIDMLEMEIDSNFNPETFESVEVIDGLAWLIEDVIPNPIEFLETHSVEEVINVLIQNNPNAVTELFYEGLSKIFEQQLEHFSLDFAGTYR